MSEKIQAARYTKVMSRMARCAPLASSLSDPAASRWFLAFCLSTLALAGCGFHLRGLDQAALPAELAALEITGPAGRGSPAPEPLAAAVREALATQGGARVVEAPQARERLPALVLAAERVSTRVLSVGASGKVNEYLLRYEVDFRLLDADGREWLATQTLRFERSYSFDPLNVLAKEREENDLVQALRREAAARIVRRLSKWHPAPPAASGDKPE
jgi:LPS-assembly lipoprotein